MINIHGVKGIGKTSFVKELLKYLSVRDVISNKIDYYDFTKEETLARFSEFILRNPH